MELSVAQAAGLLGVPESTVYGWIDDATLPARRVGDQLRLSRTELLEWATSRGLRVSSELFAPGEATPSLERALAAGGVHRLDAPPDPPAVLAALVAVLPLRDDAERGVVAALLAARERMGSTAVGGGVALPHARCPIVEGEGEASVTLAYLARPLDLHAPDGRPVGALFVLLSPTPRAHLQLLARLAAALHDPGFRAALDRREGLEGLLAALSGSAPR